MARVEFKPGNMLYPVPAVMVSCMRPGEKPNIITVAWAGTICSDPAMVSISVRPNRYSHAILMETKEFVINLTTEALCKAIDFCGVRSGRDIDKYKEMRLTPSISKKIAAPGIAESPVNIECKVTKVEHLGTHDMFLAEVVAVTVDEAYLNESGRFELNQAKLVTYSHGEYFALGKKLGKFGYSVDKRIHNTEKSTEKKNQTDEMTTKKESSRHSKAKAQAKRKQNHKRTAKNLKTKSKK